MDKSKTGRYIAALRKKAGLTPEELAKEAGVSEKTVSRWESGAYLPDPAKLKILAKTLDVTMNELLAGEKLTDRNFRQKAEENLAAVAEETVSSMRSKLRYFRKKWRRDHILLYVLALLIPAGGVLAVLKFGEKWMLAFLPLLLLLEYTFLNNRMMAWAESKVFDKKQ